MFRSVPLAPLTVTTRPVRAGRRIAVLDVSIEQDGVPVGQGRAVLLRRSQQPSGTFRPAPAWDAQKPPLLGPPRPSSSDRWTAPWESWPVGGADGAVRGGLWIRDVHPLITGEQLTPLARVAMAADLASPVSNFSTHGLSFINADYTVYLGREPQGEYVGIQPARRARRDLQLTCWSSSGSNASTALASTSLALMVRATARASSRRRLSRWYSWYWSAIAASSGCPSCGPSSP
jgi:hypothetical protein